MLLTKNGTRGRRWPPGNSRVNDCFRIHRTIIYGGINTLNLQIEFTTRISTGYSGLHCLTSTVGSQEGHLAWGQHHDMFTGVGNLVRTEDVRLYHSCMSFCLRLFSSLKGSDSNGQDERSLVWGWVRTTLVEHQLYWISLMTQVENTYAWARARLEIVVSKMADVVFKKEY